MIPHHTDFSLARNYFDHNATSPIATEVAKSVSQVLMDWGNPSSIHGLGRRPKLLIREARSLLAQNLNCHPLELIYTSGGSEANTTVMRSLLELFKNSDNKRNEIITSTVEHPSVARAFDHLEKNGFIVHRVPVSLAGEIDLSFYRQILSEKTLLVSVMLVNNETGNIFPIKEMARIAHKVGALFHTDAVQALGKLNINLQDLGVDYASFSAHKFYCLKGTGVLFQKKGAPLSSLIFGGGQERHRRGGTENVLGIHALRVMTESLSQVTENSLKVEKLRNYFEQRVLAEIAEVQITGGEMPRVANTSSLVIAGVDGETLLMSLDLMGFAVSTGAACSSGNPEPSPVLLAMGLSRQQAQNSLRVSMGWQTSIEEVDQLMAALKVCVSRLREISDQEVGSLDAEAKLQIGSLK